MRTEEEEEEGGRAVIPLSSQVWRDARALISHEGVGMGMCLFVRAKKDESMCQHKKATQQEPIPTMAA